MKASIEKLAAILTEIKERSFDGKTRLVSDSDHIKADGQYWGLVNDHGNVEIGYRGRNNRLYWIGGLV